MTLEAQNKEVIRQMLEAVDKNGFPAQADFFAERSINHGIEVPREAILEILHDISLTFPDVKFESVELLAEKDQVVVDCRLVGTHLGKGQHPYVHEGLLAGVPPTGKRISVHHIHRFRLKDGLIIEHSAVRDDFGMMRQLGLSTHKDLSAAQSQR